MHGTKIIQNDWGILNASYSKSLVIGLSDFPVIKRTLKLILKPSHTVKSQYTVFICAEFYGFSKLFSDYSQIVFTDNLNFFVISRIRGFYQSSRIFGSIRFRYPCSI